MMRANGFASEPHPRPLSGHRDDADASLTIALTFTSRLPWNSARV
jgi:hypothetical protein